ncbi:MAG: hypothetical protein ACAH80_13400 [Alphaproteobacteria bacterium]
MFGKKIKAVFTAATSGAAADVRRSWQYTTHPDAGKALEAAGARYATIGEVAAFLAPFSKTQQKQSYNEVNGTFRDDDYYVATRDFTLPPLHGALSVRIIVPKGIHCTHADGLGHSQVFDMNDHTLHGSSFLMLTSDLMREVRQRGGDPKDYAPPPPATPAEIASKAAAHAQNGLPQAITVRRISLKQKAS